MNINTNPYHQFLRMVWRMRKTQKTDEKYPSRATQAAREREEREVDKWLESVGVEAAKIKQLSMTPEEREKRE
jgi:hypothetical protein